MEPTVQPCRYQKAIMRNQSELDVRRFMVSMQIGQSVTLSIDGEKPADVETYAKAFAKNLKINVTTVASDTGVSVTRHDPPDKTSIYPELDGLELGDSFLFKLPSPMHQRIRQAATFRNKTTAIRLSCTVEPTGIRVTRLPATEGEWAECGPIEVPKRITKYDLDRLADVDKLSFEIIPAEHHKLRLAVSTKARLTGWRIRCRIQDDGSMLVYRVAEAVAAQ